MNNYLFPIRLFTFFVSTLCLLLTYFNNQYLNYVQYSIMICSLIGIIAMTIYDGIKKNNKIINDKRYNLLVIMSSILVIFIYIRFFFDSNLIIVSKNLLNRYEFINMYMWLFMLLFIFILIYHLLLEFTLKKQS
jgi:hypothetical protein